MSLEPVTRLLLLASAGVVAAFVAGPTVFESAATRVGCEPPAAVLVWTPPTATVSNGRACLGHGCAVLGENLARRVAGASDGLQMTADLEAVVVGRELWSVQEDRAIVLAAPTTTTGEAAHLDNLRVAGNAVITDWSSAVAIVLDPRGHIVTDLDGDGTVAWLDDTRLVYASANGQVAVLGTSGAVESRTYVRGEHGRPQIARVDGHAFGVVYDGVALTVVDLAGDGLHTSPLRTINFPDSCGRAD